MFVYFTTKTSLQNFLVNSRFYLTRFQQSALVSDVYFEVATFVNDSDVIWVTKVHESVCKPRKKKYHTCQDFCYDQL